MNGLQVVRDAIAKNDLIHAIDLLKNLQDLGRFKSEIIQHQARLEEIRKGESTGAWSLDETSRVRARVRGALLNLIAQIEQEAKYEGTERQPAGPSFPDPTQLPERKEQIVHQDDMVPITFLAAGYNAGSSVAKLHVSRFEQEQQIFKIGNPVIYHGTGWLITTNLLITNHHVVNARSQGEADASSVDLSLQAANTVAQFDFDDKDLGGQEVTVQGLEAYNKQLDYAVLRLIQPVQRPGLRLAAQKVEKPANEYIPVNIIQHPNGRAKMVAFRNNLVSGSTATDLRYFTDTDIGSSGSPVFDDKWKVVALHRGSTIAKGVTFQGRSTAWLNVGTHISSILQHLQENYSSIWQEVKASNGG